MPTFTLVVESKIPAERCGPYSHILVPSEDTYDEAAELVEVLKTKFSGDIYLNDPTDPDDYPATFEAIYVEADDEADPVEFHSIEDFLAAYDPDASGEEKKAN